MDPETGVGSPGGPEEDPLGPMPFLTKAIRLDPELYAATKAEAERLGVSWSEYVRGALVGRVSWSLALRAVRDGADPETLLANRPATDAEAVRRLAERVAELNPEE